MKRFAKIILVFIAVVAALLLLVLVGVNLYLQSGDVQQRIRLATQQALGMPVTVKRTLYTPWSGLTLSGLSLPDPTIAGATMVDAPKFSVQFEFLPLFKQRFIVTSVSLQNPHLALRQTEDRRWVLLPSRPARPPGEKPLPSAEPGKPALRLPAYTVELQEFHVSGGSADITDRKGRLLARVKGLILDGRIGAAQRIEGDLWVESIEIGDQLYPNRLRAHFVQEGDRLSVTDAKCAIADGKVRAEFFAVAPRKGVPQFHLKAEVEEISLPALIGEAHGNSAGTTGTLLGRFDLRGNPLDNTTFVGGGELTLDAGQLRPVDFIQQLGMILHIDELQMLHLQQANLRFGIRDQKFLLTDLTLKTDNIIITGKGPIRFDGKMNLDGRLMLNQKLQQQLGGLIGDNFTPSEDASYKQVAFNVTGRIDRPKTNLIEKITGIQFGNMGGLLKGLFRAPKSQPDQSANDPAPAPATN